MGAATVLAEAGTGASVTWATAEGGVTFNLSDSITDTTTPISIPTATGTVFSWIKNLVLDVTVTGTTTMSNRTVKMSTSPATGIQMFWKLVAVASYAQAASGNRPSLSGSNGATPAGYTLMTTSAVQYDNTGVATSSTGPSGGMFVCVIGVDNSYVGAPGTAIALPSIIASYDEA